MPVLKDKKKKEEKSNKIDKTILSSTVKIISHGYIIDLTLPSQVYKEESSIGSGFFIDKKGTIVTCAHVVENARTIICKFKNGKDEEYECDVLKICFDNDLAILRIKDNGFSNKYFLELGSIDDLEQGNKVLAYGFPLGNSLSNIQMSKGIISGRDRYLIQTDTAINPGNSGGPLIYNNKVIGVNSSKLVGEGVDNIGFATPIDLIKILNTKDKNILVKRPELSVLLYPLNKAGLDYLDSKCKTGVYVSDINEFSPLHKIIKKGDVICSFNGISINNKGYLDYNLFDEPLNLKDYLNFVENDAELKISFWNGKNMVDKKFKFEYKPRPLESIYPMYEPVEYEVVGGMVFMNLYAEHLVVFPELIFMSGVDIQKRNYVILTKVFPHSVAYKDKNMAPSKLITKVNNIEIENLKDFIKAMAKPKKDKQTGENIVVFEMSQGEIAVFNDKDLGSNKNETYFPKGKKKY